MATVEFIFLNHKYKMINVKEYLFISDILIKYCSIINQNANELYFIFKGRLLHLEKKIKINELNENNIKILVFKLNKNKEKLKQIICTECKE